MANIKLLDVEIITPQKVVFSGKATSVTLPGSLSAFQVLYNHAPIVSSLDAGIVKLVSENNSIHYFAIEEGFTEVRKNKISILVSSAVDANLIDIDSVNESLKIASESLSKAENPEEKAELRNNINKSKIKIKAYNKQKGN